jgi:non-homologous end joining protein Ku
VVQRCVGEFGKKWERIKRKRSKRKEKPKNERKKQKLVKGYERKKNEFVYVKKRRLMKLKKKDGTRIVNLISITKVTFTHPNNVESSTNHIDTKL